MKIPLAEHFHSIQGEGFWTGTPMHFIRLPGCSVGKLERTVKEHIQDPAPLLSTGKHAWQCHTFDGTPFWCDTDFNKYVEVEGTNLLAETWESHICLTGGEPLIHREVINWFRTHSQLRSVNGKSQPILLHIETSGTIDFWWEQDLHPVTNHGLFDWRDPWLTVSPKQSWTPYMVKYAQELKLLVDKDFNPDKLDPALRAHPRTYLSPINDIPDLSQTNLQRALDVLKLQPGWRLSVQLHKYLGVR